MIHNNKSHKISQRMQLARAQNIIHLYILLLVPGTFELTSHGIPDYSK